MPPPSGAAPEWMSSQRNAREPARSQPKAEEGSAKESSRRFAAISNQVTSASHVKEIRTRRARTRRTVPAHPGARSATAGRREDAPRARAGAHIDGSTRIATHADRRHSERRSGTGPTAAASIVDGRGAGASPQGERRAWRGSAVTLGRRLTIDLLSTDADDRIRRSICPRHGFPSRSARPLRLTRRAAEVPCGRPRARSSSPGPSQSASAD